MTKRKDMNKLPLMYMLLGYGLLVSNILIYHQDTVVFILTMASFFISIFLCAVFLFEEVKHFRMALL